MTIRDIILQVALLHLVGYALEKGSPLLTATGGYLAIGSYPIRHSALAKRTSWVFGASALFAAISLAAVPRQAGFASEWHVSQTVFQGLHLPDLAGRLVLALAGAGSAQIAAVTWSTLIRAFGTDSASTSILATSILA